MSGAMSATWLIFFLAAAHRPALSGRTRPVSWTVEAPRSVGLHRHVTQPPPTDDVDRRCDPNELRVCRLCAILRSCVTEGRPGHWDVHGGVPGLAGRSGERPGRLDLVEAISGVLWAAILMLTLVQLRVLRGREGL